jgi:cytochrome c oxidase subunit 3
MTSSYAALDASEFPRVNADKKHPLWWGIWGLIAIELTVVMGFVVSYFYLRMGPPDWPPDGLEPPPLLWETANLACLLASAAAMWRASKVLTMGRLRAFIVWIAIALLLDSLVLLFRWFQFQAFDFRWSDHAYGSIVWTITGFHFTHVASAILGTAVVEVLALKGFWNPERQLAVVVDTLYWYFVSLAWIPLYLTVYWVPRLL